MDQYFQLFSILPFPDIDPVIFSVGPFDVRWYGLAYVCGILLGWVYAKALASKANLWPNNKTPMTILDIDDFILWAAIGIVAGGRIGYIFFYDLSAVIQSPIRAFQVWNGGMSFHGGLVGTLVAMILFAKLRKINMWHLFDIVCAAAPIGIFFGRISNFINGELWGRLSGAPWAFVFPEGGPFARHPSQLYEALLEGVVLFVLLAILAWKFNMFRKPGFIAGTFLSLYACSRIFVEFFREPDAHIGFLLGQWLTMGMLLSLPLLAVGIWSMITANSRTKVNE